MTTTITRNPRTRVQTRTNFVRNPRGFSATTDYVASPGTGGVVAISRVNAGGPAVPNVPTFVRATWTTAATTTGALLYSPAQGTRMPAVPGRTYYLTLSARYSAVWTFRAVIRWYDASGAIISASAGSPVAAAANTWTLLTASGVAPAGAVEASVYVDNPNSVAMPLNSMLDLTAVQFDATQGPFFDGRYGTIGGTYYSWAGAADASISIAQTDNPADVFTPALMTSLAASRVGKNTIIDIPGSSLPSVVLHPTSGRRGKMTFLLGVESAAIAFDALMSQQAGFVLADTDRGIAGMAFNLDNGGYSYELDMETQEQFTGEVSFVEVFS